MHGFYYINKKQARGKNPRGPAFYLEMNYLLIINVQFSVELSL